MVYIMCVSFKNKKYTKYFEIFLFNYHAYNTANNRNYSAIDNII